MLIVNAFIQSKNKTHTVNNKKEKISFLSSLSRLLSRSHSSVCITIQMHHLFRYKLYISSKLANFIIDRFGFDAFFMYFLHVHSHLVIYFIIARWKSVMQSPITVYFLFSFSFIPYFTRLLLNSHIHIRVIFARKLAAPNEKAK